MLVSASLTNVCRKVLNLRAISPVLFFLKKRFLTLTLLTNIQGAFISIVNESSSPDLQENLLKSVLIFLFPIPFAESSVAHLRV